MLSLSLMNVNDPRLVVSGQATQFPLRIDLTGLPVSSCCSTSDIHTY